MGNKDDRKHLEFKVSLKLKNIPIDYWEEVMKQYKKHMLSFEKSLRYLADEDKIPFKILDKISDSFKFDEIHYLKFSSPEEDSLQLTTPRPAYTTQTPSLETIPQQPPPQFPTQIPPPSQQPQQQISKPEVKQQTKEDFTFGGAAFDQTTPTPGFEPTPQTSQEPEASKATEGFSFSIPSIGQDTAPGTTSDPSGVSIGVDEEDRATGIAILRRKMLMELRKIRNVVEEQSGQEDTF
ncbi:MAG: hypothetical protein HeimC3_45960 [Candidatus Heimdallarchaeota archaeon LC_3]|nr:MAG: hypothetical protein HeimC3_45960 [Candidatus Heimdallarchaeota archaeon LC_3]